MAFLHSFNRSMFNFGLFHGLLVLQTTLWRKTLRWGFRFVLFCFLSSQIYLISKLFDQLPADAWNTIFGNLFEPVVFFCFLVACMFGILGAAYTVMAGKVLKSLVE